MSHKTLPLYQFSRIPNTEEGRALIAELKKYLNPRYKVRVRGQGLNALGKQEGWRRYTFGAPLSRSTHLRVYIQEK